MILASSLSTHCGFHLEKYVRNEGCSPCRRKYGALLKKETRVLVLQLRKYKESSMDKLKGLTLAHEECVHYFSHDKGGNMPK